MMYGTYNVKCCVLFRQVLLRRLCVREGNNDRLHVATLWLIRFEQWNWRMCNVTQCRNYFWESTRYYKATIVSSALKLAALESILQGKTRGSNFLCWWEFLSLGTWHHAAWYNLALVNQYALHHIPEGENVYSCFVSFFISAGKLTVMTGFSLWFFSGPPGDFPDKAVKRTKAYCFQFLTYLPIRFFF